MEEKTVNPEVSDKPGEGENLPRAEILDYMQPGAIPTAGQVGAWYGVLYDPKADAFAKYNISNDKTEWYLWNHGNRPTFIPISDEDLEKRIEALKVQRKKEEEQMEKDAEGTEEKNESEATPTSDGESDDESAATPGEGGSGSGADEVGDNRRDTSEGSGEIDPDDRPGQAGSDD